MARARSAQGGPTRERAAEKPDWFGTLGWRCFLALVAVVPLAIAALPSQVEAAVYVRAFDPTSLPKAVAILVLAGLSLACWGASALQGGRELRWHPVLWVVAALVGWGAVSAALSASVPLSVWGASLRNDGLVSLVGCFVVAFLGVQYVRSIRELRTVMVVAAIAGVVVSAYALAQAAGIDPIDWGTVFRVVSTFGNADILGDYLLFPLALAAGLALLAESRSLATRWWVAAGFIGAALISTQTRGAWIGALVGALVAALLLSERFSAASRRDRALVVSGGLAAAALVSAGVVLVRVGVPSATDAAQLLSRLSNGRSVIWADGLRAWLARPLQGWGPDAFQRAFQSVAGAEWYRIVGPYAIADNAHNLFVGALVALGIPGLALECWALGQTAAIALRRTPAETRDGRIARALVAAGLLGMLTALLFGVSTPPVTVWLWLSVGLLLAPHAHAVALARWAQGAAAALGIALALWAGSWLAADLVAGWAMRPDAGLTRYPALEQAVAIDPLAQNYRDLAGDALFEQASAEQQAGASAPQIDATLTRAIAAYEDARAHDAGDAVVRIALANALLGYGRAHPGSDATRRAGTVAAEATALAPRNPVALAILAQADEAAGRHADALKAAAIARSVAPDYAMQALGSLVTSGTAAP